ncbi:MAG: hypothetical protein H6510_11265 [Acidobacteria bacterium]|nr:hypothetical protein [Acidobacteriota bacterium]
MFQSTLKFFSTRRANAAWLFLFVGLPMLAQDLQVVSVMADSLSIDVGGSTTVTVTLRLNGTPGQSVSNVEVIGYKSHDPNCSGVTPPNYWVTTLTKVDVGIDYDVQFPLEGEPGDNLVYAVAKITNSDSNPSNNCNVSQEITVRYPDLVISSVVNPPHNGILAGDPVEIRVTVENQDWSAGASTQAAPSTTRYYLSTSSVMPSPSDLLVGLESAVPQLGVNDTFECVLSFVPTEPLGTYYLYAEADAPNTVVEANETNNFSPAMELRIVDYCTQVAGIAEPFPSVGVNDLAAIVNEITSLVTPLNAHMNLAPSPEPLPEVINIQDLQEAYVCWGNKAKASKQTSAELRDFWVSLQPSGYAVNVDVEGSVSGIEVFAKLPSGFQFSNIQVQDVLGTSYTDILNPSLQSYLLVNEKKALFSSSPDLNGVYTVAHLSTDIPFDLSNLVPLASGEILRCGVAVQVIFADGTQQVLQLKYPFADFPDSQFRGYVSAMLGLNPAEPIPADPLTNISNLYLGNKGIADLSGLDQFPNLMVLSMANNQVTQLPDLSGFGQLAYLDARFNGLATFPKLPASITQLYLTGNDLSYVPALSLPNLTTLDLNQNHITHMPALTGLTHLEAINLSDNELAALPAFPTSLKALIAANNRVHSAVQLSCGTVLDALDLSHNQLFDLTEVIKIISPQRFCFPLRSNASVNVTYNNLAQDDCAGLTYLKERVPAIQYLTQNYGPISCGSNSDRD